MAYWSQQQNFELVLDLTDADQTVAVIIALPHSLLY